jgi:hypothetical protein
VRTKRIAEKWYWVKDILTTEEKNNKLLATHNLRYTAWQIVAFWGRLDVLQKIWEWAKDSLTK